MVTLGDLRQARIQRVAVTG